LACCRSWLFTENVFVLFLFLALKKKEFFSLHLAYRFYFSIFFLLDQKERKSQAQPIASAPCQTTRRLGKPALLR
jgi:hypothetical protein